MVELSGSNPVRGQASATLVPFCRARSSRTVSLLVMMVGRPIFGLTTLMLNILNINNDKCKLITGDEVK